MSSNQQNTSVSSSPSQTQQTEGTSNGKMMTQNEYLKYKQGDSNANNYYGFSREADVGPVAWVCLLKKKNLHKLNHFLIFSNFYRISRMDDLHHQIRAMSLLFQIAMHRMQTTSMDLAASQQFCLQHGK